MRSVPTFKTYSFPHNLSLDQFFYSYRNILNQMIGDIWNQIQWREKTIRGKKQKRLLPTIPSYSFKKTLRNQYLTRWEYAAHWVDSALKTAFSIISSWKKNYVRGNRKRKKPVVKRCFVRVKQTLMKISDEKIRITIKPHQHVNIDLSKRYFSIKGRRIGEPILTPTKIHLPIEETSSTKKPQPQQQQKKPPPQQQPAATAAVDRIGWDSNKFSVDGFSPSHGWIKIDLKPLHTLHVTYDNKMRNINKVYSKNRRKGKQLYRKYGKRCRNRVKNYLRHIAKQIIIVTASPFPATQQHGFEKLEKRQMNRKNKHKWNRELNQADWRLLVSLVRNLAPVVEVSPFYTSKTCSRCGGLNKALRSERVFECPFCGLRIDRQLNASINIYLRMRGVSPRREWFDATLIAAGGLPLMGAERSDPDELARGLNDALKPQVYVRLPLTT
nr:transposase [Candidatus Freyarchaeota archaeon]